MTALDRFYHEYMFVESLVMDIRVYLAKRKTRRGKNTFDPQLYEVMLRFADLIRDSHQNTFPRLTRPALRFTKGRKEDPDDFARTALNVAVNAPDEFEDILTSDFDTLNSVGPPRETSQTWDDMSTRTRMKALGGAVIVLGLISAAIYLGVTGGNWILPVIAAIAAIAFFVLFPIVAGAARGAVRRLRRSRT